MSEVERSQPVETVFLRAPRIFARALYAAFGEYKHARPHIKPYQHWMSISPLNPDDRFVIHGTLDRESSTIKGAIKVLHVGIIATQEMGATWLKISQPGQFLHWDVETRARMRNHQMDDEVVAHMSEQYASVGAEQGALVTDERLLQRISQYSELLTVLSLEGSFWGEQEERPLLDE